MFALTGSGMLVFISSFTDQFIIANRKSHGFRRKDEPHNWRSWLLLEVVREFELIKATILPIFPVMSRTPPHLYIDEFNICVELFEELTIVSAQQQIRQIRILNTNLGNMH